MIDRTGSQAGLLQAFLEHDCNFEEAQARAAADTAMVWLKFRSEENDRDALFRECESPMERSFLLGAMTKISGLRILCAAQGHCLLRREGSETDWELYTQYEVFPIGGDEEPFARVDFVLMVDRIALRLAIEIDGHEFHEKTKEQAQRDKERDRKLVARGFYVIRFTGSEVYADAGKCWADVVAIVDGLQERLAAYVEHSLESLTAPATKQIAASATQEAALE